MQPVIGRSGKNSGLSSNGSYSAVEIYLAWGTFQDLLEPEFLPPVEV